MPLRGHEKPPATEPHVFWFGNSSTLVDRFRAVEEMYRENDGWVRTTDVADVVRDVLYADWDPTTGRPRRKVDPGE